MGSFQNHPFPPSIMESAIRKLLENRAVNLRPSPVESPPHGFICIGIAKRVPDLHPSDNREVFVWHVPSDLLSLSEQELERWRVDAPKGRHWILSERELSPDSSPFNSSDVIFWGPDSISNWIGQAVLSGELVARNPDGMPKGDLLLSDSDNPDNCEPISLKPSFDPAYWLAHRGMEGSVITPVLLNAKLWTVTGDLVAPSLDVERDHWSVIEDPWSACLRMLDYSDQANNIPDLRTISPADESWLPESRLHVEIQKLLEVRKRSRVEETDSSGPVKSMLLEKWSFRKESAQFHESALFIPGWIIQTTGKILHGSNGRTYNLDASPSATT